MDRERVAEELVNIAKDLVGGCEKLPEGGMRDNCEKKKEESEDKKASRDLTASRKVLESLRINEAYKREKLRKVMDILGDLDADKESIEKAWPYMLELQKLILEDIKSYK